MTRRTALTLLTSVVGMMTEQLHAQKVVGTFTMPAPSNLLFDLRSFKNYQFSLGSQIVTFTPEQLMAAILEKPTEEK